MIGWPLPALMNVQLTVCLFPLSLCGYFSAFVRSGPCVARIRRSRSAGLSAWELACQLLLTITLQVNGHFPLSAAVPHIPRTALLAGTQRARPPWSATSAILCLQSTRTLSVTVAGLRLNLFFVCLSRPLSGRVVVRSELLTQPMRC